MPSFQEVQVVMFAGGSGSRMYPITEDIPKSLLPIANKPLITYPLELLSRCGVRDVIVLTRETMGFEGLSSIVSSNRALNRLHLDIVTLNDDDDLGTADALHRIRHKLTKDFIVVSSDLVLSEPEIFKNNFVSAVLNFHRLKNSLVTVVLHESSSPSASATPTAEISEMPSKTDLADYIGIEGKTNKIVFFRSAADVDDGIRLPKSLLRTAPHILLRQDLTDSHFYVFHRKSLEILELNKKSISSIKGEFIPFLIKRQFSSLSTLSSNSSTCVSVSASASSSSSSLLAQPPFPRHDNTLVVGKSSLRIWSPDFDDSASPTSPSSQSNSSSTSSNNNNGQHSATTFSGEEEGEGCYAFIMKDGYCCRGNTFSTYLSLNKDIATGKQGYTPDEKYNDKTQNYISELAEISQKTQVGAECVVGQSTIGDRCSVKKTVIGNFCKIGNNVKINSSVIMDNVTIENNCVIQGSVVCSKVTIGEKSTVKDCQIAVSYDLPANSDVKNEMLVP